MLHLAVETAFEELLAQWRTHDSRRHDPRLSVAELASSRHALDLARSRMYKLRVALYPDQIEQASIVESIWCESLESVVHVRWADRDATRPGNFRCPCGHLVPIDWDHTKNPTT